MAKKSSNIPVAKASNPKSTSAKAPAAAPQQHPKTSSSVGAETALAVRKMTELPAAGPTTAHVNGQLNGHMANRQVVPLP